MVRVRDELCRRSFAELFRRWRPGIERLSYRMTHDWQAAEDLTQEVFVRLLRNRERYEVRAGFGTYLWTLAINLNRDYLRKQRRMDPMGVADGRLQGVAGSDADPSQRVVQDEVRVAVGRLPQLYREVVLLRHYEQMKFHQIAEVLQIPPGTVASRMAKALKLLHRQLVQEPTSTHSEGH